MNKKIHKLFRKKEKPIHQQIALKIPRDFREMTFTEKTRHYPIQDRMPQQAFIKDTDKSIIGVRHTTDYLHPDQLEDYLQNVFDKNFNTPNFKNYQSSIIQTKKTLCIFTSYTLQMDEPLFVMNLVGSHRDTMLFVTFSCPEKEKIQWETPITQIFKQVKMQAPSQ